MNLIECKNVSFSYDGKVALEDVNFYVKNGDYICVIGENGSGKSTLIKGLLKLKSPLSGEIIYNGIRSSEIGYLPQQANISLDFPASVFEVVLSGRLNSLGIRLFYNKKDKEIALYNMKILGITDLKDKNYNELSGGQRQRVLLARALCATKKILLLDEPVSGLDPVITLDLYNTVYELNRKYNIAVIMVSHDISSAVKYASKILHLEHKQVFFGDTEDYLKNTSGGDN